MHHFKKEDIIGYLEKQHEPVMEANLLKNLAGINHLPSGTGELFKMHFALYNVMYNLKEELAPEGLYLHLDPMRIRLIPFPETGCCFHYIPVNGIFCSSPCDNPYCIEHINEYLNDLGNLSFDILRDFYINGENISFGESLLLKKLMKGVIVYALKKGEVRDALSFFGIEHPSKDKIKKRYYDLALKYHPDVNMGNDGNMKILNRSYQVLQEAFGL